jgi:hypothetical protein
METLVPEYGVSQLGARPMGVEKSDLLKFLAESGFGNDVLTFRDGGAFYACLAVEAIIGAYVLGKGLRNLLVR